MTGFEWSQLNTLTDLCKLRNCQETTVYMKAFADCLKSIKNVNIFVTEFSEYFRPENKEDTSAVEINESETEENEEMDEEPNSKENIENKNFNEEKPKNLICSGAMP